MRFSARDTALFAILIALALALSFLETLIPLSFLPLPGIKLGLANIIILYALYTLDFRSAFMVLICKCILASLFGGGLTAFAFSICGGTLAISVMQFIKRGKIFSIFGVSIGGAAAHGIGQTAIAALMMKSVSVIYYLPFLLFSALFTGFLTAVISSILIKRINYVYKKENPWV